MLGEPPKTVVRRPVSGTPCREWNGSRQLIEQPKDEHESLTQLATLPAMAEADVEEDVKVQKGSSAFIKDIDSALLTIFPPSISASGSKPKPKRSHHQFERETHRATRTVCNHPLDLMKFNSSPICQDR